MTGTCRSDPRTPLELTGAGGVRQRSAVAGTRELATTAPCFKLLRPEEVGAVSVVGQGPRSDDLARWMNPIIRGWMNYYGRFRRSVLSPLLLRVNTYLARWAQRKYKGLRAHKRLRAWWERFVAANPTGFAHWQWMRHYLLPG